MSSKEINRSVRHNNKKLNAHNKKINPPVTKRTKLRYVDIKSEPYMVGREYMVRLEKEDFIRKNLSRLAKAGPMSVCEFKKTHQNLFELL